jgi:cysteinyl-tRNA synthetase
MEEALIFAANCKLLGFRNLDKPGYFRFGVSALNVGSENLFSYEPAIHSLRAALANNAPDDACSAILSEVRAHGLDVDISRSGDITLVRGDHGALKEKIEKLMKESDRIRDELAAMGVVLKDSKDGTTWETAR